MEQYENSKNYMIKPEACTIKINANFAKTFRIYCGFSLILNRLLVNLAITNFKSTKSVQLLQ